MISGADEPEYIEYIEDGGDDYNEQEQLTTSGNTEDEFIEVPPEN